MKNIVLICALLITAACGGASTGGLTDWSSNGLTFDAGTRTFNGLPKTTLAQMPVAGSATYNGTYQAVAADGSSGQGTATMNVTFGLFASSALTLSGWVDATAVGLISNTGVVGASPGLSYLGEFYNSDAGVVAGEFSSAAILGQYIASK